MLPGLAWSAIVVRESGSDIGLIFEMQLAGVYGQAGSKSQNQLVNSSPLEH